MGLWAEDRVGWARGPRERPPSGLRTAPGAGSGGADGASGDRGPGTRPRAQLRRPLARCPPRSLARARVPAEEEAGPRKVLTVLPVSRGWAPRAPHTCDLEGRLCGLLQWADAQLHQW